MRQKLSKAFTLIELLIVIVIIGILATALVPRIQGMQGRARDTKRLMDLKQIQSALAMYHAEKGSYPNTYSSRRGNCSQYGGYPLLDTAQSSGYIPGLAPYYMTSLPIDPKPSNNSCYIYHSNGRDYNVMARLTVEGNNIPPEFLRQAYYSGNTYSVYSPGGKDF